MRQVTWPAPCGGGRKGEGALAYQVLARRWRPQRFEEVVGQEHVTRTLANAIRAGRLAHAFLFCGPRGVGKTTTARILAKCLNCEKAADGPVPDPCNECPACREIASGRSLDVLEIDGASNRGIDEIRDLRENVRYAPSAGRAKVYIIDEVHMLTKEAFNALLKTLEEPPSGVYFVFATTEPHKVPATIRSRCQTYEFHRIPPETIARTLAALAAKEGFDVEPAALAELARQADGGLRDAQSLLDQAVAVAEGGVTLEGLRRLLGEAAGETYLHVVERTAAGDAGGAFEELQQLLERGMDPGRIAVALTATLRDLLVVQTAPDSAVSLGVRADSLEEFRRVAAGVSGAKLTALLALASRTVSELRRSPRPRLTLEVALARMSRLEEPGDLAELAARLDALGAVEAPAPQGAGPGGGTPSRAAPSPARTARRSRAERGGHEGGAPSARFVEETTPAASPASDPPVAVAPAPVAPVVEGKLADVWSQLLQRVRGRKVMLASFLERGVPEALDDEALVAVFDNNYYEGMVNRRENLAVIHEELTSLFGHRLRFKVRMGALPAGARPATEEAPRAAARPRDLLQDNPGLRRVVHDLGGQVLRDGDSFTGGDG